jgi:hypothetical protein
VGYATSRQIYRVDSGELSGGVGAVALATVISLFLEGIGPLDAAVRSHAGQRHLEWLGMAVLVDLRCADESCLKEESARVGGG